MQVPNEGTFAVILVRQRFLSNTYIFRLRDPQPRSMRRIKNIFVFFKKKQKSADVFPRLIIKSLSLSTHGVAYAF